MSLVLFLFCGFDSIITDIQSISVLITDSQRNVLRLLGSVMRYFVVLHVKGSELLQGHSALWWLN